MKKVFAFNQKFRVPKIRIFDIKKKFFFSRRSFALTETRSARRGYFFSVHSVPP